MSTMSTWKCLIVSKLPSVITLLFLEKHRKIGNVSVVSKFDLKLWLKGENAGVQVFSKVCRYLVRSAGI